MTLINMTPEVKRISPKETAVFVRKAIKAAFPDTKFSVKTHTYSGGASVDIHWTDGPRTKDVEKVAKRFEGADFDGMIDLKVYSSHWLLPDGTVELAHRPGTDGSLSEVVSDAPHPDAVMMTFGADFIFCQRRESDIDGLVAEADAMIRERCKLEGEAPHERFANQWVSDLAWAMARDKGGNEEMEAAFRRIVLREN